MRPAESQIASQESSQIGPNAIGLRIVGLECDEEILSVLYEVRTSRHLGVEVLTGIGLHLKRYRRRVTPGRLG